MDENSKTWQKLNKTLKSDALQHRHLHVDVRVGALRERVLPALRRHQCAHGAEAAGGRDSALCVEPVEPLAAEGAAALES